MNDSVKPYRSKALEALAGARSELANGRFNNAASRAYYGAYDAAIVALLRTGLRSRGRLWGHDEVQARFAGELIRRRKLYPADFASVLYDLHRSRIAADYGLQDVSRVAALTSIDSASRFISRVIRNQST